MTPTNPDAAATSRSMTNMTPFPSDLSIFSHNDEEVADELGGASDVEEVEEDDGDDDDNLGVRVASSGSSGGEPEAENANSPSNANRSPTPNSTTATTHALVKKHSDAKHADDDDDKKLAQELLDALYLGTGNFLLAYNTRAGIGVLMRIFRLLRRRNLGAIVDLTQLLDEKHLSFRVEAVSMGLFLGWFTGGYRALRALLPRALSRLYRLYRASRRASVSSQQTIPATTAKDATTIPLPESATRAIDELATLLAGAGAACAIAFVAPKRRRSLALYALTRALQCGYNTAKRKQYWHFWGSDWAYGDALLFALSSAQVMYAFIMRPQTLPADYFRFIQKTGPVEKDVLEMVRRMNRGLALDPRFVDAFVARHKMKLNFQVPHGHVDMVSCRLVHHHGETCTAGVLQTFRRAFASAFPLYLSLFIVPSVVIHFKKFLARPVGTLARAVAGATRSNLFVASYVALYMAFICAQRRVMMRDHRFVYYVAGFAASVAILIEPKSRRSELALYVLPRALDSLFLILRDRRVFAGVRHGAVLVFALSMACMMHTYEHEKQSMGAFLHSTLKRFLQSPTDKKKIFLAHLEQQQQQQQRARATSSSSPSTPSTPLRRPL